MCGYLIDCCFPNRLLIDSLPSAVGRPGEVCVYFLLAFSKKSLSALYICVDRFTVGCFFVICCLFWYDKIIDLLLIRWAKVCGL